jgi:hypothetical protein
LSRRLKPVKRAVDGSVLSIDAAHCHYSPAVAAVLTSLRGAFSDPGRFAQLHTLWCDLFVVVLPLLRELDPSTVQRVQQQYGANFVGEWARRAVSLINDAHTSTGFYAHLLQHWQQLSTFAAYLPQPLTPAAFGQDADESEWRAHRRAILQHTTFNGGYFAHALSAPAGVQLLQRALTRSLLRWLLCLPLITNTRYDGDDDGDGSDDDGDGDDAAAVAVAAPPPSFDALIALLDELRRFYLPPAAVAQHQQLVSSLARPVVSQTAIDKLILDERAAATELQREVPTPEELLVSLRERVHERQRARFDEERVAILQRIASSVDDSMDVTANIH